MKTQITDTLSDVKDVANANAEMVQRIDKLGQQETSTASQAPFTGSLEVATHTDQIS